MHRSLAWSLRRQFIQTNHHISSSSSSSPLLRRTAHPHLLNTASTAATAIRHTHTHTSVSDFLAELHARHIVFQHTEGIEQALTPPTTTQQQQQHTGDAGDSNSSNSGGGNDRVRIYAGFDPTADGLHVGNLFVLTTLKRFLQLGFVDIVALVGGGTGLIGDPSGRKTERPLLTVEQVQRNVECIRQEVNRFLLMDNNSNDGSGNSNNSGNASHDGDNSGGGDHDGKDGQRVIVVNNHDWLSEMTFIDLLRDYGKLFQMNQMLRLESVRSRLDTNVAAEDISSSSSGSAGMTFAEFSYVIFQSYDFYRLHKHHGVRVQIGGSDQWGNIISGIDLIRKKHNADIASSGSGTDRAPPLVGGITLPLLTTADGVKFGKSAGNAVFLNPQKTSVFDFYQFFVRVQDADVRKLLTMLTFLPLDEIDRVMERHESAPEKREAQKVLAREMTRAVHGEEELHKVERSTALLYASSDSSSSGGGDAPGQSSWSSLSKSEIKLLLKDAPSVSIDHTEAFSKPIVHILKEAGICKSTKEARRTVQGGGLYINNERIDSVQYILQQSDAIEGQIVVVRLGKRNYHILEIAS